MSVADELLALLGTERRADSRAMVEGEVARRALDELRRQRGLIEQLEQRVQKADRDVISYRAQMGAAQVDRERSLNRAGEIEEACLRAAAARGLDGEDIQKQVAHDRHLRWLQVREEAWHDYAFGQVMGLHMRLQRLDGSSEVTIGYVAEQIAKAVDRGPRDAHVDRVCGKEPGAKRLPDLSIPDVETVTVPASVPALAAEVDADPEPDLFSLMEVAA